MRYYKSACEFDVLKDLDILPKDPVKQKRRPGRPPKKNGHIVL
jgi:hypothetical protein